MLVHSKMRQNKTESRWQISVILLVAGYTGWSWIKRPKCAILTLVTFCRTPYFVLSPITLLIYLLL